MVSISEEDQVQPSVSWPLFELTLHNGNAPVILRSYLGDIGPAPGCWSYGGLGQPRY